MSEERVWVSMGTVEGKTIGEACQALGQKALAPAKKVGGYSEVTTDKGTLQLLPIPESKNCEWLAFRLVDRDKAPLAEYVPSGKPPRKQRSDVGKPRKKNSLKGGFEVVEIPK